MSEQVRTAVQIHIKKAEGMFSHFWDSDVWRQWYIASLATLESAYTSLSCIVQEFVETWDGFEERDFNEEDYAKRLKRSLDILRGTHDSLVALTAGEE